MAFYQDAKCDVEAVEQANNAQLHAIMDEIMNTTYFRLFRIDLDRKCRFWGKGEDEEECENTIAIGNSVEPACALDVGDSDPDPFASPFSSGFSAGGDFGTSSVDKTITEAESESISDEADCDEDASHPKFWTDMCSNIPTNGSEYVNLQLNPERWTGYNGSHVWSAIYEENCFKELEDGVGMNDTGDDMCYEVRVLYRLLSGMHASINIHISDNYFPPKKGSTTKEWAPNPKRFMHQYGEHPERLKNLHFAFVVLLRAVRKAAPFLYDYNFHDEPQTQLLVRRLLDSYILQSCNNVFEAFDESMLFKSTERELSTALKLKREFKGVFHNISSVLDCVTCQKCKLHGKMQLLGLGTALKVLLLPNHLLSSSITRDELVAFFNTIGKFSHAITAAKKLSLLYWDEFNAYKEKDRVVPQSATTAPTFTISEVNSPVKARSALSDRHVLHDIALVDSAIGAIASLAKAGQLTAKEEDVLIDLSLGHDAKILLLAKHFSGDFDRFKRHALRNVHSTSGSIAPHQSPVVVIGAGLAGLSATLTLLDRGAQVVLVEKEKFMGGNSAKASSGINGVDPNNTVGDSVHVYRQDTLAGGHATEAHPLLDRLVEESGSALEWLKVRVGMNLSKTSQLGGHSKPRTYRPPTGMAGSELILALQKIVKKFVGGQLTLILGARVTEFTKSAAGRVNGIKYIQSVAGGKEKFGMIEAENILIATGGYGADTTKTSLITANRPDLEGYATTNGRWATGDGHKMSAALGADLIDLDDVQVHPTGFFDEKHPDADVCALFECVWECASASTGG